MCEETGDWPLDIDDLLRFSFQVAQGLDFLAAKNVSDFAIGRILNVQVHRIKHFTAAAAILSLESKMI